jgi:hypothetical protein
VECGHKAVSSDPLRVNRVDFVMSTDVRFVANFGLIDWQLPALCHVPLVVEVDLLVGRAGVRRCA